jgi:hypothetical protein
MQESRIQWYKPFAITFRAKAAPGVCESNCGTIMQISDWVESTLCLGVAVNVLD